MNLCGRHAWMTSWNYPLMFSINAWNIFVTLEPKLTRSIVTILSMRSCNSGNCTPPSIDCMSHWEICHCERLYATERLYTTVRDCMPLRSCMQQWEIVCHCERLYATEKYMPLQKIVCHWDFMPLWVMPQWEIVCHCERLYANERLYATERLYVTAILCYCESYATVWKVLSLWEVVYHRDWVYATVSHMPQWEIVCHCERLYASVRDFVSLWKVLSLWEVVCH
jgi:hypothetical protein